MSMMDTLKAVGIPVTAAAVVSALVVSVPLLFKLDERYAKEEDLKSAVAELERANDDLQRELAQLSGFQQAMTSFIREGRIPVAPQVVGGGAMPVRGGPSAPQPTGVIGPVEAAPPPPPPAVVEAPPVAVPEKMEAPRNWRELGEGLARQQQRLVVPRDK